MAKKKRLTRKQIKRQKSKKVRARHQTHGKRAAKLSREEEKAITDLMSGGEATAMESISKILFSSDKWINEPEFAEIFFSPVESMEMFVSEMENQGFSPENFTELDQEAQEDLRFEIIQKMVPRLLTRDKRQEIIAALDALGQRWQRFHKKRANEVILAKLFLTDFAQKGTADAWLMASLIHALVERSIATGFELIEATHPLTTNADDNISILDMLEGQPDVVEKKATKLLKRLPGLRKFMEDQSDKVWEEGSEAILNGDLYLALFTEDELSGAAQVMQHFAQMIEDGEQPEKKAKTHMDSFVLQMDEYIVKLMTPERFTQLQTRIREILQKEQVDRQWLPFVSLLHGYFRQEDAVENERPFLLRAIMGELRTVIAEGDEEE